jgi:hypothetical protein
MMQTNFRKSIPMSLADISQHFGDIKDAKNQVRSLMVFISSIKSFYSIFMCFQSMKELCTSFQYQQTKW